MGRTCVAGEGQRRVGGSRPRWEMLGVRRLLAHESGLSLSFLGFFFAVHYTKNTLSSKLVPPGIYKKALIVD